MNAIRWVIWKATGLFRPRFRFTGQDDGFVVSMAEKTTRAQGYLAELNARQRDPEYQALISRAPPLDREGNTWLNLANDGTMLPRRKDTPT